MSVRPVFPRLELTNSADTEILPPLACFFLVGTTFKLVKSIVSVQQNDLCVCVLFYEISDRIIAIAWCG